MKTWQNRLTKKRVNDVLKQLNYDYTEFSLEHFVKFVEQFIHRRIMLIGYVMPIGIFGVWITDDEHPLEYIFYDESQSANLRAQTIIHELAHIIFNHPTLAMTAKGLESSNIDALVRHAQTRRREQSKQFSIAETEAELFTALFRVNVWNTQHRIESKSEQPANEKIQQLLQVWGG